MSDLSNTIQHNIRSQWLRYRQDGTGEVDASVPSII